MYVQIGTLPVTTHYHDGQQIIFSPGWRLLGQNCSRSPGSHMYDAQGVLSAPPPPGLHTCMKHKECPSPLFPPKNPKTNGAEFTKAHPAVTARTNRGQHDSSLPAVYIQLRYYPHGAKEPRSARAASWLAICEALASRTCRTSVEASHAASRMWRGAAAHATPPLHSICVFSFTPVRVRGKRQIVPADTGSPPFHTPAPAPAAGCCYCAYSS